MLTLLDPPHKVFYPFPMLKAVFSGSFDPPTLGHLNIIERASAIFDELIVIVAENRQKNYLFSARERMELLTDLVTGYKNVSVTIWDSLIVEFMKQRDVRILVRGVRGVEDFSYEFELSMMNKALSRNIETLFMTTVPEYFVLRSSSIKVLASFQGDVSGMVPPAVEKALKLKFPV
jgi:pantetheine-phosphate adenylyltransferase